MYITNRRHHDDNKMYILYLVHMNKARLSNYTGILQKLP